MAVQETHGSALGRLTLFLAVVVMAFLAPTAGQAAMTDYQREQITQYLHSPNTDMDAGIFDGQSFDASVRVDDAAAYMNGFIDTMNRAVRPGTN